MGESVIVMAVVIIMQGIVKIEMKIIRRHLHMHKHTHTQKRERANERKVNVEKIPKKRRKNENI